MPGSRGAAGPRRPRATRERGPSPPSGHAWLLVGALLLAGALPLAGCADDADPAVANPASVHCAEEGGTLEIRAAADGSETGYCLFDDGSACEEWAFYRGECAPGDAGDEGAAAPALSG